LRGLESGLATGAAMGEALLAAVGDSLRLGAECMRLLPAGGEGEEEKK